MIFFHNPNEENGYLSNWFMSEFDCNGVSFACAEQYMMWSKAMLFDDTDIAKQILSTSDCGEIKQLGRQVRGFDEKTWATERCRLVTQGLIEKFRQNSDLREKLLATGDEVLAECAVHDRIWGIGLSMTDANRFDCNKWRGQNLLGYCLMQTRDYLRTEK